ncbi:hypothetical protein IP88_08065 [alpha proteobacterium AAP81b]|nr:hypothetical protein IP88_08065 [alpha proteobacterium AAP81b]
MATRTALLPILRRAAVPALCLLAIGYFVSHAITGPTGVVAWRDYARDRARLDAKLTERQQERAALERQVKLLDPGKVDRDLAEELVRGNLNVVAADEVIVPLPPETAAGNAPAP